MSITENGNTFFANTTARTNFSTGSDSIAVDPGMSNIVQRSGATATTTATNTLNQAGATFQTWGITPGIHFLYLASGTGSTTGVVYAIASILAGLIDAVDNFVDTEVAAIKAKTDLIPAAAVGDIPTVANIWAQVIETGFTATQSMRLILAALAGKLSGAATVTVTIRDVTDTKARITATVDADGNRTAITTDVT